MRTRRAGAADGDERSVALAGKVVAAQVAVLHVVEAARVRCVRGALPLQLEHDHAAAGRTRLLKRLPPRVTMTGILLLWTTSEQACRLAYAYRLYTEDRL